MALYSVAIKQRTRLSLKWSACKGFINFASKKILGPKKILCQKKNFKEKFGSEKFWSEKRFCLKKLWSEKILVKNFFWTNKIFGLKSLGPKKFRI